MTLDMLLNVEWSNKYFAFLCLTSHPWDTYSFLFQVLLSCEIFMSTVCDPKTFYLWHQYISSIITEDNAKELFKEDNSLVSQAKI